MLRNIFFTILCLEGPRCLAYQGHASLDPWFLLGVKEVSQSHIFSRVDEGLRELLMGGKPHCHTNMLCWFRAKNPSVFGRYDTFSNKKACARIQGQHQIPTQTSHSHYPLIFSSFFVLFQWASQVNSSCIHSPDTDPSAVCFQPCRPDRKMEFWTWFRCCSDKGHGNTFS